MKRYWPLLAIVVMLSAIMYMSQYADSAKKHCEEGAEQAKAAAVAKGADAKAYDEAHKPYEPPVWAKYVTFPEGVGAWAIVLTLFVIAWQAVVTSEAAEAGAESANAAYGSLRMAEAQFELMKEKERARLELNVVHGALEVEVAGQDLIHLIATLSIRNIGASRAFIRRTYGTLITKLRDEPLSRDYDEYSPLELPEQYIDPDEPTVPVKVYCFPSSTTMDFADGLEQGSFSLHFFGFIEYETLGLRRTKPFGYDWKIVARDSVLGGLYGLGDPYPNSPMPARDRITHGYWQPNEERDIPEYPASSDDQ